MSDKCNADKRFVLFIKAGTEDVIVVANRAAPRVRRTAHTREESL